MTTVDESRTTTPSRDEIIAKIQALSPLLAANAGKSEADRRVAEESIQALREAGVFKVPVARRHGGYEMDLRTMLEVSAAVAKADGGTAWATTLINVNSWMMNLFPRQATDEIYAANRDARAAGVLAPDGTARRVPGGYQVSGRWHYASGIWHADWAGVGVLVEDENGQVVDQGMALVPQADYTIDDVWFVAGMKASGSNCVVVQDVFVPEHRVLSSSRILSGDYLADHPDEPLYRSAVSSVLVMVLVGPQLGLGRAALKLVTGKADRKGIAYTVFGKQTDSVAFQLQIAEAATQIDTAHLHAYRAVDDIDRYAKRGEYPDLVTRARIRADAAVALQSINSALNTLVFAHGAGSFADVNPLQRIWRDSNVGARHAVMLPAVNFEVYGKALLAVPDQITPLV